MNEAHLVLSDPTRSSASAFAANASLSASSSEILKLKSASPGKRFNSLQRQRSRLAFRLRCFIFFSVILVFFIKFIIDYELNKSDPDLIDNDSFAKHHRSVRSLEKFTKKWTSSHGYTVPNKKENCTSPAISEFPSDGLTKSERQSGWIAIHMLIAFYCFWLLAVICDDYFVPALEQICANFDLQKDVVGATIMAAATSSPELFMNVIGTFITKGDIGIGAIVGSSVFNILAVPAFCGLFVSQHIKLHWWPLFRDCTLYCLAILGLIATLYDGIVMWYEALLLLIGYVVYLLVMCFNDKMSATARRLVSRYQHRKTHIRGFRQVSEITPLIPKHNNNALSRVSLASEFYEDLSKIERDSANSSLTDATSYATEEEVIEFAPSPWKREDRNIVEFIFRWPITFILWITVPDGRRHPSCKHVTFIMSIVWIAVSSFTVAFVMTIIGDTLNIPDSVMGLTVLAAGMSLPEAMSSIIVTKQGEGAMGISNSIGSNTFDILLCLSLPWFIKATFLPVVEGEHWIVLTSNGLTYSAIFLLTTLMALYLAFIANHFVLDWKIGLACLIMYIGFLVLASLMEMNIFFQLNLPVCTH